MTRKRDTKLIDAIARKHGLSKGQRRILHVSIHGRRLKYSEIDEEAKQVKRDYPSK